MQKQKGQILLILLLVMVVALTISLAIIQRSLSDLSSASKVEQSSRAFSAAEAGIEQALGQNGIPAALNLGNLSVVNVTGDSELPKPGELLDLEFIAKESFAHVWLADFKSPANPPPKSYNPKSVEIFWGGVDVAAGVTPEPDAAIEITVIYYDNGYKTAQWFYDHNSSRSSSTRFSPANCPGGISRTVNGKEHIYHCLETIDLATKITPPPPLSAYLILLRARLIYNQFPQAIAVGPTSGDLPFQAKEFIATGTSGQTQRKIEVRQIDKVVPFYFDFAIFSAGEISK